MLPLTYSNIRTIIEAFVTAHPQINDSQEGNLWDANTAKKIDGAYLLYEVVNVVPSSAAAGNKRGKVFNLSVYIVDVVEELNHATNKDYVKNECQQIGEDLLSWLYYYIEDNTSEIQIHLGDDWVMEFVEQRMSGLYAGIQLNFSLKTLFNYKRCLIPL